MRLSWNEIRVHAAQFAEEWKDARYEKGEAQTFYNEFFEIFGVTRRRVASFEEPVKKLGDKRGFIDLFWKGKLLVEQKSAGGNLTKAKEQAFDYFPGIKEADLPRYVLVSDFQTFELHDLDEGTSDAFTLRELPKKVQAFGFILGVEKRKFRDQDPVNIEASELMGQLHDALESSGYSGHDLERFLVRLLFCLFADATGIFEPEGIFTELIKERTSPDGSDVGQWLARLFEVLDTPKERRQKRLDEDLARFDYINGQLFSERLSFPDFDSEMRGLLIQACEFRWDAVSPAIFGALFQWVMKPEERRKLGAHYTMEKSILKVIEPLFLDGLRSEFNRLRSRRDTGRGAALDAFHHRLAGMKFLDPACGCGNFLVVAYRELRQLEIDLLHEIYREERQYEFNIADIALLSVDQFYGIEIDEFPARIAEVAMWMMDHIKNNDLAMEFGQTYARIPIRQSPHIHCRDALEFDWKEVLAPEICSFVFGNPPFGGSKYQSDKQREQVRRIAKLGGSGGTLDFVTPWFIKAGEYVRSSKASIGFVATNSITQGEQVAQLWPILFERCRLEIAFAHRTFAWDSDVRGKAHVHVVIVGLVLRDQEPTEKRLFSYDDINGDPHESRHRALTPYLFDAGALSDRHIVVEERSTPLSDAPKLISGTQPIDDGNYVFDDTERAAFLEVEPSARQFLRPYIGSEEYINGKSRWILFLKEASPKELRLMPHVVERMRNVSIFRHKSKRKSTSAIADLPERYNVEVIPNRPFLVVPKVSSERRDYIPIGWLQPPTVPSDLVFVLQDADLWHFGLLTSRMHMAWLRHIGGRLKSDYRYSIGIVYNPFPWPRASDSQRTKIRELAQAVLDARLRFRDASLADLYDATVMKPELRRAHHTLDQAVDQLYRRSEFVSDRERVEHLFGLYETLVAPLTTAAAAKPRRNRPRLS